MRFVAVLSAAHALNLKNMDQTQNTLATAESFQDALTQCSVEAPSDELVENVSKAIPDQDYMLQTAGELHQGLDEIQDLVDQLIEVRGKVKFYNSQLANRKSGGLYGHKVDTKTAWRTAY